MVRLERGTNICLIKLSNNGVFNFNCWNQNEVLNRKMRIFLIHVQFLGWIVYNWGSPHEHWNQIHWIRIPYPDSMWSRELHRASPGMQTTRIVLLTWISRIRIEVVWRQTGLWTRILDPNRIQKHGPVWKARYQLHVIQCQIIFVSVLREQKYKQVLFILSMFHTPPGMTSKIFFYTWLWYS